MTVCGSRVNNIYAYNVAGNRTSAVLKGVSCSYTTPAAHNRLASWTGGGSMTYNTAGCVTALNRANKVDVSSLNWDSQYQLTSAVAGNIGVYYSYDALGRKIERLDGDGGYEYYFYDGNQIVADFDGNEWRVIRSYTYGPGIDNILSMTVHGSTSTNTYYYLKDLSNTVLSLVNASGIAVEYYNYDAYGNVTIRNGSGTVIPTSAHGNRFLFQGREYDYTTQLYHFRARWYDSETGRWLSNDPIGISGGLNLYAFCGNAPVNFVDPMGLWGIQFGDFLIGCGDPWLAFDESSLDEIGKGAAATADGMIPFFDPFKDNYSDECGNVNDIYKVSQSCGQIAFISTSSATVLKAAQITGVGMQRIGYKGGEITFTKPRAPTPDFRINPFGGSGYPPHYHRRPGIGKHRPWDGGF